MASAVASAYASAYNEIRRRILDGTFIAGHRLRETQLVSDLRISRTPIREALRRLHSEGLVVKTPNKGARVASWSEQDFDDVFGMRLLLESHAARFAALRIRHSQIAELKDLATTMEGHLEKQGPGFYVTIAELNNEFHGLVVQAAGSDTVMNLLGTVVSTPVPDGGFSRYAQMPLVRRALLQYTLEELHRSAGHHRELIAALQLRDADWAEAVVRTHILASRGALRGRMSEESSDRMEQAIPEISSGATSIGPARLFPQHERGVNVAYGQENDLSVSKEIG